jgi:hypothetical protein
MPHHEILVTYALPAGFEFQCVRGGRGQRQVNAKILRCKAGDTISWKLATRFTGAKGRQFTGFTVEFLTKGSPFDTTRKKFQFTGPVTPPKVVIPWASSKYFPYQITLDGIGLRADPGVGVDPPGWEVDVGASLNRAGALELITPTVAVSDGLLRFSCQDAAGNPLDFTVTFGGMTPPEWPVYPPGSYPDPLVSLPGYGVTQYLQVVHVTAPQDFPFTLTAGAVSLNATLTVKPA